MSEFELMPEDDDEPDEDQRPGIPAFIMMEPGEQRDFALRTWCVGCFLDGNGITLTERWRDAVDLARFIETGEMAGKTSLRTVK